MCSIKVTVHEKTEALPVLSTGEIQVWQVSTDVTPAVLADYKAALSEQELARVPFFEFDQARDNYIISQGALRKQLSGYLNIPVNKLNIGRRTKGKPYSIDDPNLHFNISNSGNLLVLAFTRISELGIDIEQVRPLPDLDEMINRNFTAREIRYINSKPEEKANRFFLLWTIKESYLKAIGEGMRLTPDNLEFTIENNRIKLLSVKGIFEQEDWSFRELVLVEGYVGTVVFDGGA